MIGRVLNHYKILEPLGRGGMGEVFVAEDTSLDRRVALKVLPEELASSEERRHRFEREAKAVAALNHPNIVTIHSVESADGVHFITMELVEGQRLSELIPNGGMDVGRFLQLAIPMAEAVAAAHGQGITHRDLKPDNIMVTNGGQPKILDFGLAKVAPDAPSAPGSELQTEGLTGEGRLVGTVSHMSPEQAEGKAVDHRSDVFSLGVVFYEMLTGRRPFRGDSPTSVLSSILRDTPEPISDLNAEVPRDLVRLCRRCLAKDPTRRYQSVLDLRNELEEVKDDRDSGASGTPGGAHGDHRRFGARQALATTALIVAVGAIAVFVFGPRSQPDPLQFRPLTSFEGWERGPSWSPDGSFVAFSRSGSDNDNLDVYVMPASGGRAVRVTDTPEDETLPRWSPDNRHIAFISDRAGASTHVYLVSPFGGPERVLVDTGLERDVSRRRAELGAVPWSPSGHELLFSRRHPNDGIAIWKVDVGTGAESQLTNPPPGSEDQGATWSFDGTQVAFWRSEAGRGGLWVLSTRLGEPRPLLRDEHHNRAPTWSVDGKRLVFVSDRAGPESLWEVEVQTGRLRQLIPNTTATSVTVGRHGGLVYDDFTHDVDVYSLDVASGAERQLTSDTGEDEEPSVSPDGGRIAYCSDRTGNREIWLLDATTGEERALTVHDASDRFPAWAPDGREVLFVSNRQDSSQLWVTSPEGGATRRVSDQEIIVNGREGSPRWSPDGRFIAYLASTENGTALWVMSPDGTNARPVLSNVIHFDWYLDGRRVVFSRMGDHGRELLAANLESGVEELLAAVPHVEHRVAPDGLSLVFGRATSHVDQQLLLQRLTPPASRDGLPRTLGEPEAITHGQGLWHTHNATWAPDGTTILYSRDTDRGDLYVVENYE